MSIQEGFQCQGFFGFGAGVEVHRLAGPIPPHEHPVLKRGMYCGRKPDGCPISQECWTKHRERVDALLPEFAAWMREKEAEGLHGPELAQLVIAETGTEPYAAVMAGNMEDGSRVAAGMAPKDRGDKFTLPYPFRES